MLLTEFLTPTLSEGFKYLLLEDRISFLYDSNKEKLEKRFHDDNRVPQHYKSKLGTGDVAKNLITHFSEIDPTQKKTYVQWIIKMYLNKLMLEDIDKLKAGLVTFDKAKRQLDKKDINQYRSIDELLKAVDPFEEEDLESKRQAKSVKDDEIEWVINTSNFKVLIPKTFKASCKYGANTKWCTTSKDDDSSFKQYSNQGPLYIIIAGTGENAKKFQVHYESDQFFNDQGDDLNSGEIDYLSGFPKYKGFLNMLIKKHYAKYFE